MEPKLNLQNNKNIQATKCFSFFGNCFAHSDMTNISKKSFITIKNIKSKEIIEFFS